MYAGIFLLSVATLALEVALTRVFSLTQWYHFAFMAVAVALLGFGASGSLLAVAGPGNGRRRATLAATGFAASSLLLLPLTNLIPFDAYRLAIDQVQVLYLLLYVLALTVPFVCSGLALGALLSAHPERSGALYAANLTGSGAGCLLALLALPVARDGGMAPLVAGMGMLAAAAFLWQGRARRQAAAAASLIGVLLLALTPQSPSLFSLRLSPYKSLSIVSSFQGSQHTASRWNAFSRVDVVEGPAIHSAPGLSLAFSGQLPVQPGLTVDGDNLRTIPATQPADPWSAYADYLPVAVPLRLRPPGRVLILQAGPGQDVLAAERQQAQSVVAVEANPLVISTAREMGAPFGGNVQVVIDNGRSYLARSGDSFDIIVINLAESFRAVASGDFSLSETYIYTVEAFQECYNHLAPGGLLVVTRWAQWPPSEEIRAAAVAAAALRRAGVDDPATHVAAFRSLQTVTIMVRRGPFTAGEITTLRGLWQQLGYDPVYYPGMPVSEANHFVVMPDTRLYDSFAALLAGSSLPAQQFDLSPTSDDRPFFFHFFRWDQVGTILRNLGKTWQPFGGAGYLVLVGLLVVTLGASVVLILLPLLLRRGGARKTNARLLRHNGGWLAYFAALGVGFLFVEIPLIQRFILYLGQPVYATAVVLCALLTASGLGSLASTRLDWRGSGVLFVIPVVLTVYPALLGVLLAGTLGLPFALRLSVAALSLAPLGFLLGIPFPWALRLVGQTAPGIIPWAWAANGCASVAGSVLAAMLAVSAGFTAVLHSAALAYAAAWVIALAVASAPRLATPRITQG